MRPAIHVLILGVGGLLTLGMVILYSASVGQDAAHYLIRQLVWCALGLPILVAAAWLDYRRLRPLSGFVWVAAVAMLVLVLIPGIGIEVNGARRWLGMGGVRFQASEFAKLALIIGLACYVSAVSRKVTTFFWGVLLPGAGLALMVGLVIMEPDYSTALLLAGLGGGMLWISGVRLIHLVPPALPGVGLFGYWIAQDPERSARILAFLQPDETKQESGYQAYQAMLALGSGGWTGVGLGSGRQKFGYVPEHLTDFIFSIVGEELGLVATLSVTLAFILIVISGGAIARGAPDLFGRLLATGITFLIGFQAFMNIGVVTSALPNTGIPLPFISYGGSNLLVMLTSVGILVSIARHGGESAAEVGAAPSGEVDEGTRPEAAV